MLKSLLCALACLALSGTAHAVKVGKLLPTPVRKAVTADAHKYAGWSALKGKNPRIKVLDATQPNRELTRYTIALTAKAKAPVTKIGSPYKQRVVKTAVFEARFGKSTQRIGQWDTAVYTSGAE